MINRNENNLVIYENFSIQAPTDVVNKIADQLQEFVRKKLCNPHDINENRAALLATRKFLQLL